LSCTTWWRTAHKSLCNELLHNLRRDRASPPCPVLFHAFDLLSELRVPRPAAPNMTSLEREMDNWVVG